jgi:hypothetical protein
MTTPPTTACVTANVARWLGASLTYLAVAMLVQSQAPSEVNVQVRETAGIRRTAYPVNARVPLANGALKDSAHARLLYGDRAVPAQVAAESKWPDGSIQWLDVDFNASIAPLEEQTYRVEYGDTITAESVPPGLIASQTPDGIQIGSVHFSESASPLVLSLHYRQEDLGTGPNGFIVTDDKGVIHDLKSASATVEIVKPGPLYVVIKYAGSVRIDEKYAARFTIRAEMPNSKTWIKYAASVEDPARRLREISFAMPFSFGAYPWLWDFGTGSWSYGSFRSATDSVTMTQLVKLNENRWQIETGTNGQEQPYEVAAGGRRKIAEGWGHFQDAKEVVAFGFENFGTQPGAYSISLDGQGHSLFRFVPAGPAARRELTIYQHHVASPAQIGAATSPASMLSPLIAVCDPAQYTRAGLPVPRAAGKRKTRR